MELMTKWPMVALPDRVVQEATDEKDYGKFVIEPFESGMGVALGNSLRRILLSTLEGTAVTTLKIDGVLHEFSILPNVYEDVTEIILNVKKLRVRLNSDHPETLVIERSHAGPVTGADITETMTAEVVSEDLQICRLTDDLPFRMELEVRKGRGFVTADENSDEDQEIGVMPIDSNFSPVSRVRFRVEPLEEDTGGSEDLPRERLILELWTDGTITPRMALVEAAKIMRKHLNPFMRYHEMQHLEDEQIVGDPREDVSGAEKELLEKLDRPVMELDLSVRASNCMSAEKIVTMRDLVRHSEADLLRIRNFGKTTLVEVKKKLSEIGLTLNMDA